MIIRPLTRVLAAAPDPCSLYAALTRGGSVPGTFLLESADVAAGTGERSILGLRAALRIVCRGRRVILEARTKNGRALLPLVAGRLRETAVVRQDAMGLEAEFPLPPEGLDEASRLMLPSPLDALRAAVLIGGEEETADPLTHLAAGIFSYDLIELFEELPPGPPEADPMPHFEFWIPDRLIVVDHLRRRTLVTGLAFGAAETGYHDAVRAVGELSEAVEQVAPRPIPGAMASGRPLPAVATDRDDADFAALVATLQQHIRAGDVFQIVPSRSFSLPLAGTPLDAYRRLRTANPSPCLFFVRSDRATLLGASPEPAVRVAGASRRVTVRPIAGTCARGRSADGAIDPDLDARLEAALHQDPKELAEHMMLVDLARNDVARICLPGTREVTRLLTVERYSRVMHLVSEVQGTLAPRWDALHAYVACMNMGTLVGAPKLRAAELLRCHETSRRGVYGGAVGYLAQNGDLDTAIIIRAAEVREEIATVRAGAGVVHESVPLAEARETRLKAEAVLRAVAAC